MFLVGEGERLRLPTAGSTLPHPRPTSSSSGWRPSITARYFSSCLSDSASRRRPCPPGTAERWLQVRLGCVRLSSSCPFRLLHTFPSPRPARSYPRPWIRRSSFERRRDLNPPESRAAQRTVGLIDPPAPISPFQMPPAAPARKSAPNATHNWSRWPDLSPWSSPPSVPPRGGSGDTSAHTT